MEITGINIIDFILAHPDCKVEFKNMTFYFPQEWYYKLLFFTHGVTDEAVAAAIAHGQMLVDKKIERIAFVIDVLGAFCYISPAQQRIRRLFEGHFDISDDGAWWRSMFNHKVTSDDVYRGRNVHRATADEIGLYQDPFPFPFGKNMRDEDFYSLWKRKYGIYR